MSAYIYVCVFLDVRDGFGLLPSSSQLNVVIGDDVLVQCKANKFVFSTPDLYLVDSAQETPLASDERLEITREM